MGHWLGNSLWECEQLRNKVKQVDVDMIEGQLST